MLNTHPLYQQYLALQTALQTFTSDNEFYAILEGLNSFFSTGTREEIYPVFYPKVRTPLYLRRGTSDFSNFIQIFVRAEYSPCFSFYPENILDLGSYIGLSAVYFANRFPNAKIICVEPSSDNYEMLKLNTRAYQNITTINAGVWSHKAALKIVNQIEGDWGNIIQEVSSEDSDIINALSITDIITEYELDKIDFLKIDIEGSEKQVFLNNTEGWIDLVRTVACETHDRFLPGCTEAYEQLFGSRGFEYFQSGEFKTFIKKEFSLFDHVKA
jgi:FkbM family methyltransferase